LSALAPSWLPPDLGEPLKKARRLWMNDPHDLCGGIDLATVEASIGTLALSLRGQGYADEHIRAAVIEAIGEMASRALDAKARGTGGGFVAYLATMIKSKTVDADKRARARNADIAEIEAKVATTRVIQGKRVEAFDKAVASGAVHGNGAARGAVGRYVTDAQGRAAFDPAAKLRQISFHAITGADGNSVLADAREYVPEATAQDVDEALVAISDQVKRDAAIKEILQRAVDAIRQKYAYAAHGTPEKLAGGKPASLKHRDKTMTMSSPLLVISEAAIDALRTRYLKCAHGQDGMHSPATYGALLDAAWSDAQEHAKAKGWADYSRKTHAEAVAIVERHFAEAHEKAVAAINADVERKAQVDFFVAWYCPQVDTWTHGTEEQRAAIADRVRNAALRCPRSANVAAAWREWQQWEAKVTIMESPEYRRLPSDGGGDPQAPLDDVLNDPIPF
jgi:hypothetical protein